MIGRIINVDRLPLNLLVGPSSGSHLATCWTAGPLFRRHKQHTHLYCLPRPEATLPRLVEVDVDTPKFITEYEFTAVDLSHTNTRSPEIVSDHRS
jgi:hypothetical protein